MNKTYLYEFEQKMLNYDYEIVKLKKNMVTKIIYRT